LKIGSLVLDSWPIVERIHRRRPSADKVAELLTSAEHGRARLLMSEINSAEVYYDVRKTKPAGFAEVWKSAQGSFPITFEYADAFAAALALKHNCPLVTGDPEFRGIQEIELHWIG
jgi:predicted nucleic acid-binding protein